MFYVMVEIEEYETDTIVVKADNASKVFSKLAHDDYERDREHIRLRGLADPVEEEAYSADRAEQMYAILLVCETMPKHPSGDQKYLRFIE